jgi:PEP-CTERM motif
MLQIKSLCHPLALATVATCSLSGVASAATFIETTDAGTTIGTAITIVGEVDLIQGSTSSELGDFADLFSFTWDGGAFFATTVGSLGGFGNFDTLLSLFDASGNLLLQNDDSFFTLQSFISSSNLAAGNYLIGMSGFPDFPGSGPSFGEFGDTGSYSIRIGTSVPEPATVLGLLSIAGVGLLSKRQKSEK